MQHGMDYYKQLTIATRGLGVGTNIASRPGEARMIDPMLLQGAGDPSQHLDTDAASRGPAPAPKSTTKHNISAKRRHFERNKENIRKMLGDEEVERRERQIAELEEKDRMGVMSEPDKFGMQYEIAGQGLLSPTGGAGRISSRYGPRTPVKGRGADAGKVSGSFHHGTDVAIPQGTALQAPMDLELIGHRYDEKEGKIGYGHYSMYYDKERDLTYQIAHLQKQAEGKAGDKFKAGDLLGYSGTGGSGAHADILFAKGRHETATSAKKHTFDPFEAGLFTPEMFPGGAIPSAMSAAGRKQYQVRDVEGGGDREIAMKTLMDDKVIKELASESYVGQKDIPRMIMGYKAAIGKEFTGQGTEAEQAALLKDNLGRAGRFASAGYFDSPDQYIQARGRLSSVGGGADDLEQIMRNAVAAGMDSSKNIMEMVGAINELGQQNAAIGFNVTEATTAGLSRGVQGLRDNGVSRNMAVQAAKKAGLTAEQVGTSSDLDIFNMMEWGEYQSAFGDLKMYESESLLRASPKALDKIRKLHAASGDENLTEEERKEKRAEALREAEKLGLGEVLTDEGETTKALDISRRQQTNWLTGLGMHPEIAKKVQDYQQRGTAFADIKDKEVRNFIQSQGLARGISGQAYYDDIQFNRDPRENSLRNKPGGNVENAGEAGIQGMAEGDAKLFSEGAKMLLKAGQTWMDRARLQRETVKEMTAEDFAKDTSKAAGEMKTPVEEFSGKMEDYTKNIGIYTGELKALVKTLDKALKKSDGGLGLNEVDE
jgi:hypothetical protein